VTSLNAMQDLTKLRPFLPSFKALIAKQLLEWTRVSCKKFQVLDEEFKIVTEPLISEHTGSRVYSESIPSSVYELKLVL